MEESESEKKRKVVIESPLLHAPTQPFKQGRVKEIISEVLKQHLKGLNYDAETAPGVARELADAVKSRLRELEFQRYKIVVQVAIGEVRGQSMQMASRCFWDLTTDDYAQASYMDDNVFGLGSVPRTRLRKGAFRNRDGSSFARKYLRYSIVSPHHQIKKMYFVTDREWAIGLMICSLWCLGTWPIFFNIAERRGRLPQHTYIDYALSTFVIALLFAMTLGQIGRATPSQPNFIPQLFQDNVPSVLIAMAGGVALCLGNICMQYSLVFVGISITEVISASLAVIIGTTANFFLDSGLNCANILFPGVGCFVVAIVLGSLCHAANSVDIKAELGTCNPSDSEQGKWLLDKSSHGESSQQHLLQVEEERAVKVRGSNVFFGLGLAFITGICYGFFSPLFNIATNDQFHFLKPHTPHLVVYTSFFHFSAAFLVLAIVVNVYLMYRPILGLPKSSISAYLVDWKGRELAIMAGVVCGLGNGLQFMGGQAAGYAAADAVQALPLVGTIWGVVLFGEYRHSSRRTYLLLASMLLMFSLAVVLLVASARERP